jgi:hypothetical protein
MFCKACQNFWREATSKADPRDVVNTVEDIRWVAFSAILHRNMGELKRASKLGCRICRIIYALPSAEEHETILKDEGEEIDVVLRFESDAGPLPGLWVNFPGIANRERLIVKRIVAACDGLIGDGGYV